MYKTLSIAIVITYIHTYPHTHTKSRTHIHTHIHILPADTEILEWVDDFHVPISCHQNNEK